MNICHTLKVLVFLLEGLQMVQGLLIGVLHLEELRAEGAAFLLGPLQLRLALLIFLLPLRNDLNKNMKTMLSLQLSLSAYSCLSQG